MNNTDSVPSSKPHTNHNPSLNLPSSLSPALIPNLPPSAFYIPTFVTPAEETLLLQHINNAPLRKWKTLSHRRLQAYPSVLSNSNTLLAAPLPQWLAEPIISRLLAIPMINSRLEKEATTQGSEDLGAGKPPVNAENNIFSGSPHGRPNHCLVNEYLPGQGIHAHEDGGAYWPVVCTVSLGSHTVLDITSKRPVEDAVPATGNGEESSNSKWRILQERRSLLITTGKVYTGCLHGIEGVEVDKGLGVEGVVNWNLLGDPGGFEEGKKERQTRISLTFRDVLKVKSLGRAFGGLKS